MDSAEGPDPSAGGGDWRSHLQPEARRMIVNQITEVLNKRSPLELPSVLQNVAEQFEQKIFTAATNQADYLEGIPQKMLLIESETSMKQNPGNAQVTSNRPLVLASEDSTAQTDYPGSGDWQEELYQMIKTLKNQYLPKVSDWYNKVSMKLQHIDNHMPAQKQTEQYEKMKNFKIMLNRTLQFLNIDKNHVQLALKEKIPMYERQIVRILNAEKRKPAQTFEQSAGQTPSSNTNSIPVKLPAQTGCPGAGDLHDLLSHATILLAFQGFQLTLSIDHGNRLLNSLRDYHICKQQTMFRSLFSFIHVHAASVINLFVLFVPQSKILKNQYLAGLSDLYEISMKLPVDNHTTPHETTNRQEEAKSFKSMLERTLQSLEINKSCVQSSVKESIPTYKRKILSILNSEEWTPEKKFLQSAGTSSSGTQHALGTPPPERAM